MWKWWIFQFVSIWQPIFLEEVTVVIIKFTAKRSNHESTMCLVLVTVHVTEVTVDHEKDYTSEPVENQHGQKKDL